MTQLPNKIMDTDDPHILKIFESNYKIDINKRNKFIVEDDNF